MHRFRHELHCWNSQISTVVECAGLAKPFFHQFLSYRLAPVLAHYITCLENHCVLREMLLAVNVRTHTQAHKETHIQNTGIITYNSCHKTGTGGLVFTSFFKVR